MFNENKNFYPTPKNLIDKMLQTVDWKQVNAILEPSAGKGDIVDVLEEKEKSIYEYWGRKKFDIDCIEIDENLRHILKGKNFRVVHNDFLTYETMKEYDLIIMNPPFENGDKHLSHSRKNGHEKASKNGKNRNNSFIFERLTAFIPRFA